MNNIYKILLLIIILTISSCENGNKTKICSGKLIMPKVDNINDDYFKLFYNRIVNNWEPYSGLNHSCTTKLITVLRKNGDLLMVNIKETTCDYKFNNSCKEVINKFKNYGKVPFVTREDLLIIPMEFLYKCNNIGATSPNKA